MCAVPRISSLNVDGYFDFRRVEDAAVEIAAAVKGPAPGQGVSFRHYSSGVRVPPAAFRGYMEKTYGDAFA
ncbi:terminal uridylyltransferase cid1 [Colletotrichum spaethianum]|uniref:Terminal uridylyltransferase cid1 n=1 Tax=Colletotrichum spaethianum TaxID=700344 RepID=A0AA37UK66_9PEZI|nr:terminal uridylyltransferase cid1 [Colletotrichum spaethianum]GKT49531.1 terminal uridylyltransferase cid1 [Colletotrichum spaethianum]